MKSLLERYNASKSKLCFKRTRLCAKELHISQVERQQLKHTRAVCPVALISPLSII